MSSPTQALRQQPLLASKQRCVPGLRHGPQPQRSEPARTLGALESWAERGVEWLAAGSAARRLARDSSALDKLIAKLEAADWRPDPGRRLGGRLGARAGQHDRAWLLVSLARACIAAEMTLKLKPREAQRRTAIALLDGSFVEMPTGEGKTLATALAAAVLARDGTPVHVLTANDYLAQRDASLLAKLYTALGLTSGCVLPSMSAEARRAAYACDVVHLTGKQAGFDWMRDKLALGPDANSLVMRLAPLTCPDKRSVELPLQRGLCVGILDEADSLMLDEARTPLVLAEPIAVDPDEEQRASIALGLAELLKRGSDFNLEENGRRPIMTRTGAARLCKLAERLPGTWRAVRYRDESVRQAIIALHVLQRDQDYVVRDGLVMLVDEHSGRALPDRRLPDGLHVLLECKERCRITPQNRTTASIAFQSFFRTYVRLVGTSGTLYEARGELKQAYRASLTRVAPACPSALTILSPCVYASRADQLDALVAEVAQARNDGRPVLIGTRSVEQSRAVSAMLQAHDVAHRLLNASQDAEEAAIVAEAGQAGRVTVATNMAGRGTDIPLAEGVAACGGLHLVSLAFNDARRIDRQLAGRTARQGEPGSFRQLWTLDDPRLQAALPSGVGSLLQRGLRGSEKSWLAVTVLPTVVRLAQRLLERKSCRQRRQTHIARRRIARHTAISGHPEHPA